MHRWPRRIAIGPALLLLAACAAGSLRSSRQPAETITSQTGLLVVATHVPATTTTQAAVPSGPTPSSIIAAVANDPQVVQLVAGLQQRGLAVAPRDQSRVELLQDAPGQAYQLDRDSLYLHLYADEQSAANTAAKIPDFLNNSLLDWIGPPHFFQCGRLIALYLGAQEPVIAVLSELCAPPFYTTELHPSMPAPTEAPLTSIDAAIAALVRAEPTPPLTTPTIRRQVALKSGVALLYTYETLRDQQRVTITRFSYLDWRDPVWYPDGDQAASQPPAAPLPPLQMLSGTFVVNGGPDTPEKPDSVTFAGGLVHDPTIGQVRVTFSDGSHQIASIEQGAYLAAKLDVERVLRIEALDQWGRLVHQQPGP